MTMSGPRPAAREETPRTGCLPDYWGHLAPVFGDAHTSDLPLDHHRGVDGSHLREVLGGDVGDSGGQLLLTHRAIADDDDLVECSRLFGEDDLDLTTAIKGYLKGACIRRSSHGS